MTNHDIDEIVPQASINYEALSTVSLVLLTVATLISLCIGPFVIQVWYRKKYPRALQEEDLWRSPWSRRRLLNIWLVSSVPLLVGLILVSLWSWKSINLSNYDYHGPISVESVQLVTDELVENGYGLAQRRIVQTTVRANVQWEQTSVAAGDSMSGCYASDIIYTPCTVVKDCRKIYACDEQIIEESIEESKRCIQHALERSVDYAIEFGSDVDDNGITLDFLESEAKPTLQFYGDSDTCTVQYQVSDSLAQIRYLGYSGLVLVVLGITLQLLVVVFRESLSTIPAASSSDGDDDCCTEAASISTSSDEDDHDRNGSYTRKDDASETEMMSEIDEEVGEA